MRRAVSIIIALVFMAMTAPAFAASRGAVLKVLPHFLDLKGRHALSPSLYDRDSYQARLRAHPELRSGLRFDVHWKSSGKSPLKLKVEMRGDARGKEPEVKTLETEVKPGFFARWTSLSLTGDDYKKFGELTAWRVTLWDGDQLVAEQKSFLW